MAVTVTCTGKGCPFKRTESVPTRSLVFGLAAGIDAAAVDLVRFHRMIGAQHLPDHLAIVES